jgi:hypothetical protein
MLPSETFKRHVYATRIDDVAEDGDTPTSRASTA